MKFRVLEGSFSSRAFGRLTPPVRLKVWLWCVMLIFGQVLICAPLQAAQTPAKATNAVEVVGRFLNVKHAGDDAFGYSLRLWKQGDQIFGLLSVYTGAPADPPVGILEDVKFDPRTRSFSFSARLSTGLVYGRGYSGAPSRDRFTFSGVLGRREVSGVLKRSDELFPDDRPESKRIRLSYSEELTQVMVPPPPSYAEWKTWADEMLQRRGPKW